jgi:hypothetical protein
MATYQEELAQWRVQRKQAEISNRVEQIREEHSQAARERDIAIANNDLQTAEWRDMDCEQLEAEYNQYVPQQPQSDPRQVQYVRRRAPFVQKYGQRAMQNFDLCHKYLLSRGWTPNTKEYFRGMDTLMEMYGKAYGTPFDPNQKMLNAREAAKISGLDEKSYAAAYQQLKQQGRVR